MALISLRLRASHLLCVFAWLVVGACSAPARDVAPTLTTGPAPLATQVEQPAANPTPIPPPTPSPAPPTRASAATAAPTPSPVPSSAFTPGVAAIQPGSTATSRGVAAPRSGPVEDALANLSTKDKVGQLLFLGFDGTDAMGAAIAIKELRAGGIALLANARTAAQAQVLTADLQRLARDSGLPSLLIGIDHEGGPVQRIQSGVTNYGPNWSLGQVQPATAAVAAACTRGSTQARELAAMGINMNFAPVLDVWDNPANTVIAERAYSDDPQTVARLGSAYIQALQAQGVLAVGKHFPGHGSTAEDSHVTLPIVRHDRARMEAHELVPFRAAIEANVAAIMTAHISYPLIDPEPSRPGSLSPVVVSGLLRRELEYDGLVITDDMGVMEAVTARYEAGEAAVRAIQAGSDMLIVVGPVERQRRMAQTLMAAVADGSISLERLDTSVRRVLRAKQQAGLLGPVRPSLSPASVACSAP